ncbi:hypothetical protein MesoLjLc_48240 [Mesorhizobium sp. L-8-10]|uniref:GyrI-like domain-containing protein n=1 Tax=unclassified Mesorhizobium TaxID=325217 RepID=UPI00192938C7|nr:MULTISPECIES: GyrI-like domain-containing protein [unclassified Mesorhizobium]BCH25137.1 hypothetical protein MesoLjLb_49220 [Mesorhizobium sp. L-8-3]BCH32894.1 hypothetical protein MesoLjLc_48240 [Mesorhizobium sp. L-8-10]
MCARCGEFGSHRFAIAERAPQRLRGLVWEGTYAEAAAGAIHPLIEEMKIAAAAEDDPWSRMIIGISWNDRPDGFRYFVGIEAAEYMAPAAGHRLLSLPAMRFACVWHGPDDGDVVKHYGRMIDWIETEGQERDVSILHHREEYPADFDLAGPPVLRVMLPLTPAGNLTSGA